MSGVIRCARCGCPSPVDVLEFEGDGGGDPSLLPVLIPPDGWLGDPDGDGLLCADCGEPDEITEWMDDLDLGERLGDEREHARAAAEVDPADAALIFGVWPEDEAADD